jgi:hypothetical protein
LSIRCFLGSNYFTFIPKFVCRGTVSKLLTLVRGLESGDICHLLMKSSFLLLLDPLAAKQPSRLRLMLQSKTILDL